MLVCKVLGSTVATIKDRRLVGFKFLLCREVPGGSTAGRSGSGRTFLAVDVVGAGEGDTVVVARGSAARVAVGSPDVPVDAAVVAIIDPTSEAGGSK